MLQMENSKYWFTYQNAFGADPGALAEEYDREWGLVNYFSERLFAM